jgi:hypothetical protein
LLVWRGKWSILQESVPSIEKPIDRALSFTRWSFRVIGRSLGFISSFFFPWFFSWSNNGVLAFEFVGRNTYTCACQSANVWQKTVSNYWYLWFGWWIRPCQKLGSTLVQYLRDENVSRIPQQSTTKKNNAGVSMETKYHISLVGFENQKRKYNKGPKESKEGTNLPLKGGTREKSGC